MQETIATERLAYSGPSGPVRAYLARPSNRGPWSAMLVIHEVFGLVEHIEDMARRFAREGYLAFAPDLYSHDTVRPTVAEPDIEAALAVSRAPDVEAALAELPADRRDRARRALEWRANRDVSTHVPDLLAAVDALRTRPDVIGDTIGAIGYCMGGGLSGQVATAGAPLAAAVIYYGPIPPLDQVPNVRCPILGHYGGDDPGITSRVPELEQAMHKHGKDFTPYVYEGAPHAFSNDARTSYTSGAARLAWERTLDFFHRHLKRVPVGVQ